LLKVLLTERHWQRYETFRTEYERAAVQLAPELRHTAPSRAQYFRWLTGHLKGGTPYPDACRVLEGMLPPWTADDLFSPPPENAWQRRDGEAPTVDGLLGVGAAQLSCRGPPGRLGDLLPVQRAAKVAR